MSNQRTLVRFLSTGRCGTNFTAEFFADQGYRSFHEGLYHGEPSSARIFYLNWLGDLWKDKREKYYGMESDFASTYRRSLEKILELNNSDSFLMNLRARMTKSPRLKSPNIVVNSGHNLTVATPLVERELATHGIDTRNLILYRNPLKTIHAIYQVENYAPKWERPYRNRPARFSGEGGVRGAANIWANIYRLAEDLRVQLPQTDFHYFELERFSSEISYAAGIFDFLEMEFDKERYISFTKKVLKQPLRAAKTPSARNSDLFHDPDFVLAGEDIDMIFSVIKDVIEVYSIDWQKTVKEYLTFHNEEKQQLGFDT